jgi:hypothetical protein
MSKISHDAPPQSGGWGSWGANILMRPLQPFCRMYQAAGTKLESIILSNACERFALTFTSKVNGPIDLCCCLGLRLINGVWTKVFKMTPVPPEYMRTEVQRRRDKQKAALDNKMEKTVHPKIARALSDFAHAIAPQIVGNNSWVFSTYARDFMLFQSWQCVRYSIRQINKKTTLSQRIFDSSLGRNIQGNYKSLVGKVAHQICESDRSNPLFIDFHHFLLDLSFKFFSRVEEKKPKNWPAILLNTLGTSLKGQQELDAHLLNFVSDEDKFIARFNWHRENKTLPKGLSDISGLTALNLQEKLDNAIYERIENILRELFKKIDSKSSTQNPEQKLPGNARERIENRLQELYKKMASSCSFSRIIYELEGRDILISLLTFLIVECVIKQVTVPHRIAVGVPLAGGKETADNELDGFGFGKRPLIFNTAQAMLKESAHPNFSWEKIVGIYTQSGLKTAPEDMEGIRQRKDAKEELKKYIAFLLHNMIKNDESKQEEGLLKAARERASRLPVIGVATLGLHFLINGTFFSLGYLLRGQEQGEASFLPWLVKKFAGKNICHKLAELIVELIYHPSWKITVMHMIDAIEEELNKPQPDVPNTETQKPDAATFTNENFKPIMDFLFDHFITKGGLFFNADVKPIFDFISGDHIYKNLKAYCEPQPRKEGSHPLEAALETLLPTIKELQLYTKITMAFRLDTICFEGDGKFWEVFIREALNKLVANELKTEKEIRLHGAKFRNKYVEKMLEMDNSILREFLAKIPVEGEFRGKEFKYIEAIMKEQPFPQSQDDFDILGSVVMINNEDNCSPEQPLEPVIPADFETSWIEMRGFDNKEKESPFDFDILRSAVIVKNPKQESLKEFVENKSSEAKVRDIPTGWIDAPGGECLIPDWDKAFEFNLYDEGFRGFGENNGSPEPLGQSSLEEKLDTTGVFDLDGSVIMTAPTKETAPALPERKIKK